MLLDLSQLFVGFNIHVFYIGNGLNTLVKTMRIRLIHDSLSKFRTLLLMFLAIYI